MNAPKLVSSSPSAQPEPPNWVEIGTFVLALIGLIGAVIKFSQIDTSLASLDTKLKGQEAAYNREEVLQMKGALHRSEWPTTSQVCTVVITIDNIRKVPVQIEHVVLRVTPIEIPDSISRQLVAASKERFDEFDAVPDSDEQTEEPAESAFAFLTIDDQNTLVAIPVDGAVQTQQYNPDDHSGGKILAGQSREVVFEMMIEDGDIPALFRLDVECKMKGLKQVYTWETKVGLGGYPNPIVRAEAPGSSSFTAH